MNIKSLKTKSLLIIDNIKKLNAEKIEKNSSIDNDCVNSLNVFEEFINEGLRVLSKYNEDYNTKSYEDIRPLDELCKKILEELREIDIIVSKINIDALSESLSINLMKLFIDKVKNKRFQSLLRAYKVLKHLDGHDKTLVILGPNGSGKTSFANFLKNLDEHVKVIPASKPIKVAGYLPNIYNSSLKDFNDELYKGGVLKDDLLQKLIIGMCSEHDDISRKYRKTGEVECKSVYEKVKDIFESFFEIKLDDSRFSSKEIMAVKDGGKPYEFNSMSDGERVAFFYISTVLTAPQNSFIIVDEPENHLNPAIYNKIWEKLISIREDCQFIFISHTIDFITARTNYEIVTIKNYSFPDKFEFSFFGEDLDSIQLQYIVEILGSRKPLLFCEGTKSDYDYQIYESIFGNTYTVIPVGNCTTVKKCVEVCNKNIIANNIKLAIGIIDFDLRDTSEIEDMKRKKIYVLKCNEIEMLMIDSAVFNKVLDRLYEKANRFDEFKNKFFNKIKERKNYIIKRIVKTKIDDIFKRSIIDDKKNTTKSDIQSNVTTIFNTINVDNLWLKAEKKIDSIVASKNYDEALQYCCLEHREVLHGIGNEIVPQYAKLALRVIKNDKTISEHLKKKYFSDITCS